jgi:ribosome maturation factor RimP
VAKTDAVRTLVEPLAAAAGADVYDVTFAGGKLVVALNRTGGIDLQTLTDISRELGAELDDQDVIGGAYTLEVTSPGLERPLRTPDHYRGAVGETVTVRTNPEVEGDRRIRGVIESCDDDSFTVAVTDDQDRPTGAHRTVAYDEVERARTTFSWGPAPKPGASKPKSGKTKKARS